MMLKSIEDLRNIGFSGFSGFEPVHALRESRLSRVPADPGVYAVLCPAHGAAYIPVPRLSRAA
jgi:hypothetical protein